MRWVYLVAIVLFALAMLIFALQNPEVVTVSFLGFEARTRLATLTIFIYILGAFTGGSWLARVRLLRPRSQI